MTSQHNLSRIERHLKKFPQQYCQYHNINQLTINIEFLYKKIHNLILTTLKSTIKTNIMDFKNIFSYNYQQQENETCFPSLSWNERLIGFAVCCLLGYVIQILSFGAFLSLATGNPMKFALVYSFGNILALAATGFLLGFRKQCQNMKNPSRRICSIVFLTALAGTVVSAIVFQSKILVLLFLMVQIPAYIWYVASYIPFARDCIKSCLGSFRDNLFRRARD